MNTLIIGRKRCRGIPGGLLVLFLLASCVGETAERKAARGEHFVSIPDRLYFKNTRIRHYQAEERGEDLVVYRHDKLLASPAQLLPVLEDYWLEDRALLRLEVRPAAGDTASGTFLLEAATDKGWERLPLASPLGTSAVNRLRTALAANRDIRILWAGDTLVAFPNDAARSSAKEVVDDYLRLVGYTGE
ncbi:hypothetical protein QWY85_01650 [Neolewinella lacunae]|uniref:Uncharacterized protein n=1 Tax=Neolewinella lacunae TaxID=1517758 RepID=A0A923PMI4_9BACT|nr:hypothetical protein [Neolewinella lacunae]MBC6994411.1 hypothetical protein [Neolewinella lacunae]MDN3633342.1 hypothetical protein [Neolewinella lacunae]